MITHTHTHNTDNDSRLVSVFDLDVSFQFQVFLTQINSSLVDSNMLVRCIVLSLDRFESQTEDVKGKFSCCALGL